jgi:ribonuclease BN (tRNA processing enzyme)
MKITPIGIWGGYLKANSATSSFLIEHDGLHCLIDCSSGVLLSLQNYLPLEKQRAVVISHYHYSIVLTTDTDWRDELVDFALGTDLLISEANLYEEHLGKAPGHMAGSEAGRLAKLAGAKQLVLTHLPLHGNINEILHATVAVYDGPTELAEVGKVYETKTR